MSGIWYQIKNKQKTKHAQDTNVFLKEHKQNAQDVNKTLKQK